MYKVFENIGGIISEKASFDSFEEADKAGYSNIFPGQFTKSPTWTEFYFNNLQDKVVHIVEKIHNYYEESYLFRP